MGGPLTSAAEAYRYFVHSARKAGLEGDEDVLDNVYLLKLNRSSREAIHEFESLNRNAGMKDPELFPV